MSNHLIYIIMKANVEFPKRIKNSFIYFQIGLIAVMLVVLFILEFNFKNDSIKSRFNSNDGITSEVAFFYNPAPTTQSQNTPKNDVIEVSRWVDVFKPTLEDIKQSSENSNPVAQDNGLNNSNNSNLSTHNSPLPIANPVDEEIPTAFTVEQLPMFPECVGLDREDQKECFDEQLAKSVMKNLIYPDEDLEQGKQGIAVVEFIINENGVITNVAALNNKRATLKMQKAAERAVNRIPKLIPAKQGDKKVKIKYSIPVVFKMR